MRVGLFIAMLWVSGCGAPVPPPNGLWVGGVHQSGWQAARLELRQSGATLSGRMDVPGLGIRNAPVSGSIEDSSLRLSVDDAVEPLRLEGSVDGEVLWSGAGFVASRTAFHFVRAMREASACPGCLGWYEWKPGAALLVAHDPEGGLRFSYLGRLSGRLLPVSRDVYRVAYIDAVPTPTKTEMRFVRDHAGRVTHLQMTGAKLLDGDCAAARAVYRYRFEEVAFANGGVRLTGLLLTPAIDSAHPVVVFIHGTGYQNAMRPYELYVAREFLERGIAAFVFDKRGCGRSTGDWQSSSLDDLAGDVAAAVEHLARRADIRPDCIGVYGVSEGGWIAPAAAVRSSRVAFVVNQGGPGVPPLEDEIDDLTTGVGKLGLDASERDVALRLAQALVELYRGHEGLPAYQTALVAARQRPWFGRVARRLPAGEDDVRVQWWRKRGRFDPGQAWAKLQVPALVLIGEKDETMDVAKNIAVFRRLHSENPRLQLRVIPNAGHSLKSGGQFAADFPQQVADWITDGMTR